MSSDVRAEERIDSDCLRLVIEAPAGHGKTYQAVRAAGTAAGALEQDQRVLFLTHTNAARDTFNQRLGRAAAEMQTIHAFATAIVESYAAPLGLPRPIDPTHNRPAFDDIVPFAIEVLKRRPEIARGLALTYPTILIDEYQDCTVDQQELVDLIASSGPTRLRMFGDGFQGIYEFTDRQIDWGELAKTNELTRLSNPWRWARNTGMARFLSDAREALENGRPVDLREPPSCVSIRHWNGPAPGPMEAGHAEECFAAVRSCADPTTAVLVQHNKHAIAMHTRVKGVGRFHEGSNQEPARELVERVEESEGDAPALIGCLVKAFRDWGSGMRKVFVQQVLEACTESGLDLGTKRVIAPFCEVCEQLYDEPTPGRWFSVLRHLLTGLHGIDNWKVTRGDQLYLVSGLRPAPGDNLQSLLHAEYRARKSRAKAPVSGFMTIHRAKGLEFERVLLPYCSGSLLPNDEASRKRLYVAITRAQSHVTFLIPLSDPTPLLRLS